MAGFPRCFLDNTLCLPDAWHFIQRALYSSQCHVDWWDLCYVYDYNGLKLRAWLSSNWLPVWIELIEPMHWETIPSSEFIQHCNDDIFPEVGAVVIHEPGFLMRMKYIGLGVHNCIAGALRWSINSDSVIKVYKLSPDYRIMMAKRRATKVKTSEST